MPTSARPAERASRALPADRRALLAAADRRGEAIYGVVRRLVDELEEAAPWSLLYAPPRVPGELRGRVERLLELVLAAPERIGRELDQLAGNTGGTGAQSAREEAEFYFSALHQMTAPDRRRLVNGLGRTPPDARLSPSEADYLAELAADLKGKYSSAMMGAAASLLSDGRWLGAEVESALFPEKAEERLRNRNLLAALTAAERALANARREFPWRAIFESWRAQRPVDRYALSELVALRAQLLPLLSFAHRRALYSGDFHLLQRRETLFGTRLRALEDLHLASLEVTEETRAGQSEKRFAQQRGLLLEIAALLDVDTLRSLVGDEAFLRLRRESHTSGTELSAADGLQRLLGEEDLTVFLQLLLGAVAKRASIAAEASESGPAPATAAAAGLAPEGAPAPGAAARPTRATPPARADASRCATRLAAELSRLMHPLHEPWRAFRMVRKLQARLRILPPALTAEIRPFLAELRAELLPLLEEAASLGLLPAASAETLRACARRLTEQDAAAPGANAGMGDDLERVERLLESLDKAMPSAAAGGSGA